jgi:3-oxoadipate enol-lactonase
MFDSLKYLVVFLRTEQRLLREGGWLMIRTVNGMRIGYQEAGAGVPVLLLHAFPLNSLMWEEQIGRLSRRFHVIAPDLRGFGQTELTIGEHSIDLMASDVQRLLESMSVGRAVVVGLSMGGYVAMALYRRKPSLFRGLVLADTRATSDTAEARARRYKSAERAERDGSSAIAEDMIPVLLGPTTLQTRQEVVTRVRSIIQSNSAVAIARAQRAMAERLDSTELMQSVSVPALIIAGSEDGLTPPSEAEKLRDSIPGARFEALYAAGHLSNLEQPEHFSDAVERFVESLET